MTDAQKEFTVIKVGTLAFEGEDLTVTGWSFRGQGTLKDAVLSAVDHVRGVVSKTLETDITTNNCRITGDAISEPDMTDAPNPSAAKTGEPVAWQKHDGEVLSPVDGSPDLFDFIMANGVQYNGQKAPRFWHGVSMWRPHIATKGPSGWLVTNKASGKADLHSQPLYDLPFNRDRFTCEPLYTHPQPSLGLDRAGEAVIDAALRQLSMMGKGKDPSPRLQEAIDNFRALAPAAPTGQTGA